MDPDPLAKTTEGGDIGTLELSADVVDLVDAAGISVAALVDKAGVGVPASVKGYDFDSLYGDGEGTLAPVSPKLSLAVTPYCDSLATDIPVTAGVAYVAGVEGATRVELSSQTVQIVETEVRVIVDVVRPVSTLVTVPDVCVRVTGQTVVVS